MTRLLACLLALTFAASVSADVDPALLKPKPKPKIAKKKAAVPVLAAPLPPPEPVPLCEWTPNVPDPCDCYYRRPGYPIDLGPQFAWKECRPAVERLAIDEVPVPEPIPAPTPIPLPAPTPEPLRLGLQAWSLAGFSGKAEDRFTYGGRLFADGPVAHTWSRPVRMFARLDISALPGQSINLTNIETFGRSAEFRGGLYMALAESRPVGQHITTSLIGWGGFATIRDDAILNRYLRSGGIGLRLAEEIGGSEITVGWCRDEAAGYIGAGQICVGGSVPIAATKGAMVVGGNAVLNLSRASVTPQRDIFRFFVGVSIGDIVEAVRNK